MSSSALAAPPPPGESSVDGRLFETVSPRVTCTLIFVKTAMVRGSSLTAFPPAVARGRHTQHSTTHDTGQFNPSLPRWLRPYSPAPEGTEQKPHTPAAHLWSVCRAQRWPCVSHVCLAERSCLQPSGAELLRGVQRARMSSPSPPARGSGWASGFQDPLCHHRQDP